MRLLLILTVVIAVIALLMASWQRGKRVFAVTATVTAVAVAILAYGVIKQGKNDQVTLPPEQLRIQVDEPVRSESGVRFTGTLFNDSELDLAGVTLRATALSCPDSQADCVILDQQEDTLLLFIPAGRHYPFAMVTRHPPGNTQADKWEVSPVSRLAYPSP